MKFQLHRSGLATGRNKFEIENVSKQKAPDDVGHNSKTVHRAYAKRALMKIPSLEEYELRARLPENSGVV